MTHWDPHGDLLGPHVITVHEGMPFTIDAIEYRAETRCHDPGIMRALAVLYTSQPEPL